jgi:hypothetical protein
VSVVDEAGNAVALTTTINLEFGARLVAGGDRAQRSNGRFHPGARAVWGAAELCPARTMSTARRVRAERKPGQLVGTG